MAFFGVPGFVPGIPELLVMAAAAGCPAPQSPPTLNVDFNAEMTRYSEEYPTARIRTLMANNPDSTLATDTRSILFGVTSSKITHQTEVKFNIMINPRTGEQCLYYDSVRFSINYAPSVYVASEATDLPCTYKTTRAHEQQHVTIDYDIINKTLPYIRRDMQTWLNSYGGVGYGPLQAAHVASYSKQLVDSVAAAAAPMIQQLVDARRRNQGTIDTPENYKRESDKCRSEHSAIAKKFKNLR